jgi:radical SAM superfamily enzyme YgiQ (UPF0313 family)
MDLLLTHGYFLYEDPKELQIMRPYVPLGILYLTSHLRSKGFGVEVYDTTFSSRADLFKLLQTEPPTVLGIYANLMTRPNVVEILRVAKEAGWKTVVGGPEPAAYVREYLASGTDVVVIGEGEITLEELIPALRNGSGKCLERVNGIAFRRDDGSVCTTPPRVQIPDLDTQPWPCRESVHIEQYLQTWRQHHGASSVAMITARGCPYHCKWCSHAVYGNSHRRRSPECVVDELEWILQRYHPDMLWIADDVFTIHPGWLFRFAAELKRRHLKIPFECISRADRMSPQVIDTLAELGCFRVWIGSESGSQKILDAMQRGVSLEQVRTAVHIAKARGIQTGMFLMWGYEGEEMEDIVATVDHVRQCDPDVFLTTVAYPIKGTPYFDQVVSRVLPRKAWAEGSDRDFAIRGRHSRRYYQFADQLLRSEVEMGRLTQAHGPSSAEQRIEELKTTIARAREGMQETFAEVEA